MLIQSVVRDSERLGSCQTSSRVPRLRARRGRCAGKFRWSGWGSVCGGRHGKPRWLFEL